MKNLLCFFAILLFLSPLQAAPALRQDVPIDDGWKFIKQDVPKDADFSGWEGVSIPHTWNAVDGQNGKAANPDLPDGYFRGAAWYARKVDIPSAWKGKRLFLYFEAASRVADVYFNNQYLGQHCGGFGAFAFEVTTQAAYAGENVLRVRVDNSKSEDLPPLSGDFTLFGGIYRSVHLLVLDPTCITPMDFGSSGVYLTEKSVTQAQAVVEVKTMVSNGLEKSSPLTVEAELLDGSNKSVLTSRADAELPAGQTVPITSTLTIPQPHLWQGRKDPYLYLVHVKLLRDGKVVDEVTENLGLRTMQIDAERGFLLNGEPYPIHGVNRHQEHADKGWALTPADQDEDLQIILDMGTTAVRLAHYQQSRYFHDLCDRSGLITWEEVPVVERVSVSKEFADNAMQQLQEMVHQDYNHPSQAFWGIYNELNATWVKVKHPDAVPLLTTLRDAIHLLDPSRPVVAASWTADPMAVHAVPDWQCLNTYPGWYWGNPEDFAKTIVKASGNYGGKRIAVSEYGAGANITQHEEGKLQGPKAGGPFHPEEWQAYVHETDWSQMQNNPLLWGTFVWAMFDFASDGRNEGGTPGMNDKGLVTHDRKVKKDAYFFYQANWSEKPMVYIASRRMTPRKMATTDVKIYSNCPEVELTVNGKSLGLVKPNEIKVALWKDVPLNAGTNQIAVSAKSNGQILRDSCEWVLEK